MKKILLIDDDPLVLKTINNALVKMGSYEVLQCSSGEAAIMQIKTNNIDLVISDIRMPGKNGIETVKDIRRIVKNNASKDIPIIFITGYAEASVELDVEKLGEVIIKPFDVTRLAMTIREYL